MLNPYVECACLKPHCGTLQVVYSEFTTANKLLHNAEEQSGPL